MRTLALLLAFASFIAAEPFRFRVTLDPSAAPKGASGRLFVLLRPGEGAGERIKVDFVPEGVWLAAKEVAAWEPGETIDLNADDLAFPEAFSKAPKGDYAVMALLDRDHSFARDRQGPGDIESPVSVLKNVDPAAAEPVALTLKTVIPAEEPDAETANLKFVSFESPALSAFWGRPIVMKAAVVLPTKYGAAGRRFPAVYEIHGFGGNYKGGAKAAPLLLERMASGERFQAVHIFLDGNVPGGHHEFADSVNNGPWGHALTAEFIPYLERTFALVPRAEARFLTGHSSGGWSSLWLQVRYPEFFGGAWPTSPDPPDFRSFTGIDATPGSTQNAYRTKSGQPLNLVRTDGKDVLSMKEFARLEEVTGEYGGQLASFEWVFSPRGPDGRPIPLFQRRSGELNPEVLVRWQQYDIARVLRENWATLGPKLRGKIHLTVGADDTFHLNEPAALFCGWLKEKGREDACEIVPGRDHFTLFRPYTTYPKGLGARNDEQMRSSWERFLKNKSQAR